MTLLRRRVLAVRPATLTVGTIVLVLALFAIRIPLLELIELKAYDVRVQLRGQLEPSPAVAIAAIDERSLEIEGRWPWPRSKMAALVEALSRDGARVIGFDVAFAEPDENSELVLVENLERRVAELAIKNAKLTTFIADRRQAADNDLALANAIRASSAAVVLGYFFHVRESDLGYSLSPSQIDERVKRIGGSKFPVIVSRVPDISRVPFIRAYAPQPNLEVLTQAAPSSGYFTVISDEDGILRWMPLAMQAGEDVFPSLGLVCAWEYLGRPPFILQVGQYGVDGVQLGDRWIPTHENGHLLVNYMGGPKTFPHFPVTDIIRGKTAPGTFKDKVVLVGATAIGTYDLRATPIHPVYPGTEIHANVIDNILSGRVLSRPKWWKIFDLIAIVVLTAGLGYALPKTGALKSLVVQTAAFGGYALLAAWLFVRFDVWLNVVYPLFAISVNYTGLTTYRYLTEERERRRIKSTFRQYVSPDVVEEMLKDPQRLTLGGEERVLTVLFSDLEGFTSNSERYGPKEMIGILSEYYARMTEQLFEHRGTLKEYVGDELMAFYGAPMEQPDHAHRACATALAMREQRLALNAEWEAIGRPRLRARTGVNSGPMLVGNLGSKYRFAYGVLGDQVNLGSRLEGMNRIFGTEILVGENTARLVGDSFLLRDLDLVRAKGKKQAIRVYELVARSASSIPPEHQKALALYAAGLDAYRGMRWKEALAAFDDALAVWPEDGPSRTMAQRCRLYQDTPPPQGWDGVFEQTLKSLKDVA